MILLEIVAVVAGDGAYRGGCRNCEETVHADVVFHLEGGNRGKAHLPLSQVTEKICCRNQW